MGGSHIFLKQCSASQLFCRKTLGTVNFVDTLHIGILMFFSNMDYGTHEPPLYWVKAWYQLGLYYLPWLVASLQDVTLSCAPGSQHHPPENYFKNLVMLRTEWAPVCMPSSTTEQKPLGLLFHPGIKTKNCCIMKIFVRRSDISRRNVFLIPIGKRSFHTWIHLMKMAQTIENSQQKTFEI